MHFLLFVVATVLGAAFVSTKVRYSCISGIGKVNTKAAQWLTALDQPKTIPGLDKPVPSRLQPFLGFTSFLLLLATIGTWALIPLLAYGLYRLVGDISANRRNS